MGRGGREPDVLGAATFHDGACGTRLHRLGARRHGAAWRSCARFRQHACGHRSGRDAARASISFQVGRRGGPSRRRRARRAGLDFGRRQARACHHRGPHDRRWMGSSVGESPWRPTVVQPGCQHPRPRNAGAGAGQSWQFAAGKQHDCQFGGWWLDARQCAWSALATDRTLAVPRSSRADRGSWGTDAFGRARSRLGWGRPRCRGRWPCVVQPSRDSTGRRSAGWPGGPACHLRPAGRVAAHANAPCAPRQRGR